MEQNKFIRNDLSDWKPYSSARSLVGSQENLIYLDANEFPSGNWNRYPDPLQSDLKKEISKIKKISSKNIFLGNGSDEVLDLCMRMICRPGKGKVLICPPTYGMYEILARLNGLDLIKVPLLPDSFDLNLPALQKAIHKHHPDIIILCSPNNPTGNVPRGFESLIKFFKGWILLDEAYSDFCPKKSQISKINKFSRLIVTQTLSKAWGLAGLRIGMAIARPDIINVLNAIKPPYNISQCSLLMADKEIKKIRKTFTKRIHNICKERDYLFNALHQIPLTEHIYPSDANFLLIQSSKSNEWIEFLKSRGIVVRDRSSQIPNTFRVSVGTKKENRLFIKYSFEFYKVIQKQKKK